MTCIDGNAMAKKGRAGAALCIAAVGSWVAGNFRSVILARGRVFSRRSASFIIVEAMLSPGAVGNQASMIATARVQPAEPPRTFTGKQLTRKPLAGKASRLCSFSIWQ